MEKSFFELGKDELGKFHKGNIKLVHYPTAWLSYAYELKRVEHLIYMDMLRDWDKHHIERATKNFTPSPATSDKVYLLMIGLAIENLLKCIYLNKHPEIIKDGVIKDRLFKTHNLLQIATEKLSLTVSKDEKFMLELGEKAIKWYGRYPIPLKETDTFFGLNRNTTNIHIAFHTFFERLAAIANIKMPIHNTL